MLQKLFNSIKKRERYGGVWCKGGSMFNDRWIKTNQDFELKILDCSIFAFEIQRSFVKALSWGTHQVLNHSKQTKNEENMRLELERHLELFFKKNCSIWLRNERILESVR
jgi:hypothetical protein